jgi:5-methylcytosine-specific restriction endonuclease McrA
VNAKNAAWREKNSEYILAERVKSAESHKARGREYYAKEKEKIQQKRRLYRLTNPHLDQAYRAKNKTKILARIKAYQKQNPEKVSATMKAWRKRNAGAIAAYRNNRRARIKLVDGRLSTGLRAKLFTLQKGKCACCGQPLGTKYHLDHIMPLALGGANEDWNIQLLRDTCNFQKHAKHPVDFMQQRGFLL